MVWLGSLLLPEYSRCHSLMLTWLNEHHNNGTIVHSILYYPSLKQGVLPSSLLEASSRSGLYFRGWAEFTNCWQIIDLGSSASGLITLKSHVIEPLLFSTHCSHPRLRINQIRQSCSEPLWDRHKLPAPPLHISANCGPRKSHSPTLQVAALLLT